MKSNIKKQQKHLQKLGPVFLEIYSTHNPQAVPAKFVAQVNNCYRICRICRRHGISKTSPYARTRVRVCVYAGARARIITRELKTGGFDSVHSTTTKTSIHVYNILHATRTTSRLSKSSAITTYYVIKTLYSRPSEFSVRRAWRTVATTRANDNTRVRIVATARQNWSLAPGSAALPPFTFSILLASVDSGSLN